VTPPLLEARDVRKSFPGVQALAGVSLAVRAGEVLALVGENGAGKSTLMKILAGVQPPDAGQLLLDGRPAEFRSVADALRQGISLIHQELNLAQNLSVAANLFLGREPVRGGWLGWLDNAAIDRAAAGLLARVGLDVPPGALVGGLPPGQRQLVEIARALSLSVRVLIMDEPTSSLTQRETDRLFEVVRDLKKAGVAVIYISHRLGEVQAIADRVTVLRDGKNAGDLARAEVSHEAMVRLMVGRDLKQFFTKKHPFPTGPAEAARRPARLDVRGLSFAGGPSAEAVSFTVRRGEIVGLAGLVGAGRTELAEALFGLRSVTAGEVWLDGQRLAVRHPRDAIRAGLLLVPEDRRLHGLVLPASVQENLALPNLADRLNAHGFVARGREAVLARDTIGRLRIRTPGPGQPVGLLSGGNQQKVVLGKWLVRSPKVLICDEPTRGVDVGAKSEIYALLDELAGQGVAVLMISSDLEEILGMSDRVLVLHEGRLSGELARRELSEEAVMRLATGRTTGGH
jgi:ribose transport system ATP-binding protein